MPTATAAIKRYLTDREWIEDNYEMLAERHDKEYVAVSGGRVVTSAPSIAELKTRIKAGALFPPETPTVVYVTKDSDSFLL
jgi:hypothetical protein